MPTPAALHGMDPHLSFATRDELWQLQNDMKSFHTTQADHSDRLLRLERRLDEDTRMKSVWGASSPFPSVLGGTPQQGEYLPPNRQLTVGSCHSSDPGYNPAAEAFKSFDQEQNNNLLGSLQIDAEDEPRRGASRANSVRFDESALQGHFGHASRSSSEFFPIRTSSGLGSLPMVERSSSHKSDGRQSSMGHSTHSTRLNSLAFDSRSPALETQSGVGPPPGLFLLGPLPCIMRCWLDNKFSNEALLYAAICSGSYTSMISSQLAQRYGLIKYSNDQTRGKVTLQVFLPEATVQQSSSRPLNLIPQVPSLSIDFEVFDLPNTVETLQVIIGSDVLRSKSAELSFSQDRMVIYDDERNKLAVPLVRPEKAATFQDLRTAPFVSLQSSPETQPEHGRPLEQGPVLTNHVKSSAPPPERPTVRPPAEGKDSEQDAKGLVGKLVRQSSPNALEQISAPPQDSLSSTSSATSKRAEEREARDVANGVGLITPTKVSQAGMWGSWRRDSNQTPSSDTTFSSIASSSNYQRPSRGKGMKVLKPARSGTSRSISSMQNTPNVEQAALRWQEPPPRSAGLSTGDSPDIKTPDSPRRSFSSEPKSSASSLAVKPRTANPVGGASAFGWLNSGQK